MTADDSNLSHKERAIGELRSDIESTREKLAATLDAIEDKLNVPMQAKRAVGRAREAWDKVNKENPVVVYASAGAVVLAAGGLIAWRLVRR